jgi:hypothetical protein
MEFVLMVLLAAFALGLGFFALLKQKTYLDATGTVTAIEVPLVGKLQTNYPALLFVFVGLVFGYLAYTYEINAAKETWVATKPFTIDGQLKSSEHVADWSTAEITVIPSSLVRQEVDAQGHYRIDVEIPKWQSFDDWVKSISFQAGTLSGRISPGAKNDTSKINKKTATFLDADVDMKSVK